MTRVSGFFLQKRLDPDSSCINISMGNICICSDDSHLSSLFKDAASYNNEGTFYINILCNLDF